MIDGEIVELSAVAPPEQALKMAERNLSKEDFSEYSGVTLNTLRYRSNGLIINGWLAVPKLVNPHYPAIIFNRGGTGPKGALSIDGAMQIVARYASWGYVVVASNYRGVGGSEGAREEWGGGDVDDAMACIPLLESLSYVDSTRLGVIGGSRGGMMTFMMMARTSIFRAAVTFGAPTRIHEQQAEDYIRKTMQKHLPENSIVQQEAEKRSVLCWPERLSTTTPLLVLHGCGDRRVPADHSLHLALKLQDIEFPYKLVMYDNADHILSGRREEANADIRSWINQYVRDKSKPPRTGVFGA